MRNTFPDNDNSKHNMSCRCIGIGLLIGMLYDFGLVFGMFGNIQSIKKICRRSLNMVANFKFLF